MLFAPCCAECSEYCEEEFDMISARVLLIERPIVGRVIRALQKCFHPDCFRCSSCQTTLLDISFTKNNGRWELSLSLSFIWGIFVLSRPLCRECHVQEKNKESDLSLNICSTCQ